MKKQTPGSTLNLAGSIELKLDYTRRARVAPLGALVWKTFDVNLTWIMIFPSAKSWIFLFLHCVYGPNCEIFWFFGHIHFAKCFLFFIQKKLDVVTITRYQITFWIFDFSLLEILPKYMNPKIVSRSLYALDDLPKIADGHRTPDIDF